MKLLIFVTWMILVSCNESYRLKQASISSSAYVLKGNVSTFAGSAGNAGYLDASGTNALFQCAYSITSDLETGDLYVADSGNYVIRKVGPTGVVTTFVGDGTVGNINATGTMAKLGWINDVVFDSNKNLFLADGTNNSIRKVTPAGVVSTFSSDPDLNGVYGLSIDSQNNLYVSVDAGGNGSDKLLKFSPVGIKTVIKADFDTAIKVEYDINTDNIYVAGAHELYKVDSNLAVTLYAGGGLLAGNVNGYRTDVTFDWNWDMAIGQDGSLYVMDAGVYALRRIDKNGYVTHIAGGYGTTGTTDGLGSVAKFNWVEGITFGKDGYLYMVDCGNSNIRVVR